MYTYDDLWRLLTCTSPGGLTDLINSRSELFEYDALDRLTKAYLNNELIHNMSYYPNGNIDTKSDVGTYRYDTPRPHAISGIDNVGAGITNQKQFIEYTAFNKVSRIKQGVDEQTINRVYDIFYGLDEQRIKTVYDDFSISGHVKTRYYFGTYEKETDEFGNITETDYLYTPAGLTAMQRKTSSGAGLYYIHTDLLGSIERITNATGQIVSEYTYTPWGGRVLLSGVNITDRGYTGHEHLSPFGDDSNSGFCLINMNGRIYDPVLARFLSPDPYVQAPDFTQSFNRYAYGWNNPFKYVDPSGELIWIIPNVGWSQEGGLSIGVSVVLGIPGGASVQAGVGYSFKSGDATVYAGASLAFNTVSVSYSTSSGFSAGYTVGASPFSGLPVSTNFLTAGVNYNFAQNSWSGNVSAWQVDHNGWTFNPSVSVMVFPESTTNFVRKGKFVTNNQMLSNFTTSGDYQGALDYWGFEGTYDPINPLFGGGGEPGVTDPRTGDIFYTQNAFNDGFDKLYFVADHEGKHRTDVLTGKYSNVQLTQQYMAGEEFNTYVYNYKRQGFYRNHKFDIEARLNMYGTAAGVSPDLILSYSYYKPQWHIIYRIPRKW